MSGAPLPLNWNEGKCTEREWVLGAQKINRDALSNEGDTGI